MGVARVPSSFGVNEWGKGTELVMVDTDVNADRMISAAAIFQHSPLIMSKYFQSSISNNAGFFWCPYFCVERVNIELRQMVCGWSYLCSDFEIKMYKGSTNFNLVLRSLFQLAYKVTKTQRPW
jgi:hypothetical protein